LSFIVRLHKNFRKIYRISDAGVPVIPGGAASPPARVHPPSRGDREIACLVVERTPPS
jgi:hypothetical protein